ncbi:MAG: TRAP transporter large permease subunit [Sulfurospirillaceae bacterium]|nr:TRAP transporter large permease subunit [Sulfurospirillaceae bacterium]
MVGIVMFFVGMMMLLIGFPVAFTFGAVSVVFGLASGMIDIMMDGGTLLEGFEQGVNMFAFMPHRIWAIMNNTILMAVPMFILMGIILQKSRLAERLLEAMGFLFGEVRGGLAISTVLVGALLAASTGVVGASVVAMGVISLPVMLKYNYSKSLACGTICASGTLGQIIPPSVVLIILGDVFQQPVGDLFEGAFWPGLTLVAIYILYIVIVSFLDKNAAPAIPKEEVSHSKVKQVLNAFKAILPPLILIILVLGSIFEGIATPTESSAVGCIGAMILAWMYKSFSFKMLHEASLETVKTTAMVFAILIGATAFSMVFTYTGGDIIIEDAMRNLPGDKWVFIVASMIAIMALGFFIDFVEISYIIVPILAPIAEGIGINPVWYALLIALNLQTSFLTPPFGFSLFYLRGVAPPSVKTMDIYKGVVPFILLQILVMIIFTLFPEVFGIAMMHE